MEKFAKMTHLATLRALRAHPQYGRPETADRRALVEFKAEEAKHAAALQAAHDMTTQLLGELKRRAADTGTPG